MTHRAALLQVDVRYLTIYLVPTKCAYMLVGVIVAFLYKLLVVRDIVSDLVLVVLAVDVLVRVVQDLCGTSAAIAVPYDSHGRFASPVFV